MVIFLNVIKIVLPAIITGFITYWVTKYNKRPIDKIEISYNRIYYPLLKLIKDSKNKDYSLILEEAKKRLQKYDKYANKTTIMAYKLLEENINNKNSKNCYLLLEDDIYKNNSFFRRQLGYPEPMVFNYFKYFTGYEKTIVVFWFSFSIFFLSIYAHEILKSYPIMTNIIAFIAFIAFALLIISLIFIAGYNIKYTIPKKLSSRKKK